jgi:ADP-ribosylglycohydrolase
LRHSGAALERTIMSNIYRFPLGPLTAIAIADAAACGYEFSMGLPLSVLRQKPNLYLPHTMYPFIPAGSYSDDTQRALVLIESWLNKKEIQHYGHYHSTADYPDDTVQVIGNFITQVEKRLPEAYAHDPRGYGKGMFMKYQQWAEMNAEQRKAGFGSLFPQASKCDSAGAAMGAAVLGCLNLNSLDNLRVCARAQAELTHQGDGVLAAELTAD